MNTFSKPDKTLNHVSGPESLLILNYHRVGTPPGAARYKGMFVTPAHLSRQIRWLKGAGYTILPVSEALKSDAKKVASLTFDDGYEDNLRLGFPILKRENVRASIYLITGDVGQKNHVWKEAGEQLPSDLLNWDQIELLKANGWETGSHGFSHIHLGNKSIQEQADCIEKSQDDFVKYLGSRANTFAYPYGSYQSETCKLLKDAGFIAGLTTESGLNHQNSHPFTLKRVHLKGHKIHHYLKSWMTLRPWI